jgi:protein SCO1/2
VLGAAACGPQAPKFRSTDITGADFGKELALTDHNGKPRTLADFRGRLVVLFFGYTHCPDVCPTTLADMAGVMKKLGKDAERVQVLFVTLDPERDTPAVRSALPRFVRRPRRDAARGKGVQNFF